MTRLGYASFGRYRHSFTRFVAMWSSGSPEVGHGQACARNLADLFPKITFQSIFPIGANTDITDLVWSSITKTSHAILIATTTALREFAAFRPDREPFIECKKERDIATLGSHLMRIVGDARCVLRLPFDHPFSRFFWVRGIQVAVPLTSFLRISGAPLSRLSIVFLAIRGSPRAPPFTFIHAPLLSAILGVSHWCLSSRSVVRGGIDAETSVPSRLYHALSGSAC